MSTQMTIERYLNYIHKLYPQFEIRYHSYPVITVQLYTDQDESLIMYHTFDYWEMISLNCIRISKYFGVRVRTFVFKNVETRRTLSQFNTNELTFW